MTHFLQSREDGLAKWVEQLMSRASFGDRVSVLAAHHIAMGAETLALRVQRQSDSAMAMCHYLSNHPQVKKVYYPGLSEHAQHARATARRSRR